MKIEKDISHPVHLKHKLKLEFTDSPFKCDGCKEAGIGLEFRCKICEFDLHKACAEAAPTLTHPFYNDCEFRFHFRPPGPHRRKCDACQKEVLGFVYHCRRCGFDLHPCCANLPKVLDGGDRTIFYLCNRMTTACHCCGGKGAGWAYRSECKTYNLHVSCVKKLLVESWQEMYFNNNNYNINKVQMRIPSLRGTMKSHHHKGGRNVRKCCQMAGEAVRVIVSAILGDPTAIIASVVWGFISK